MAIADRIAINASGVIYYEPDTTAANHGGATAEYYTVLEFHRFLQDLADDATATPDDLIDITSDTPTDRSTDNIITVLSGYTLDDGTVGGGDPIWEHLYDGSIISEQENGRTWDGFVVLGPEGMDLQILQSNGTTLTILQNDFWNSIPNGETLKGLNRDAANGISHRFMLEVIDNTGAPIDGRRIIGMTRELGQVFSEFKINGSASGNNVIALSAAADLNNATADGTVAGWSTIVNQIYGYVQSDIGSGPGTEPYYSRWTKGSQTIPQIYERLKWLTAAESGTTATTPNDTLYGLDGNIFRGITHEIVGTQAAGTFGSASGLESGQPEEITWTGGKGQLLAVDDVSSATKIWMQILIGVPPTNAQVITGTTSGATFTTTSNSEFPIATPFIGQSTGSAIIGARGFGVLAGDAGASDIYTDLTGATQNPRNNVTFTVNGVFAEEDRVLVGPSTGLGQVVLQENQVQVAAGEAITTTAGSVSSATAGAGSVVLASNAETIGTGTASASDTPVPGTLRVLDSNDIFQLVEYTGITVGAGEIEFTGCTSTGTWSAAAAQNGFISYIDELADSGTVVVTDGSVVENGQYIIVSTGTTDFTLIGAADSNPGTIFTKTATAAAGTGTVKPLSTTSSVTVVYGNSVRPLFIRVRDGGTTGDLAGIKTFETSGSIGTSGGSANAIRTSDV